MGSDYYSVLGVTVDATPEEIRTAYFDAARRLHPDTNPDLPDNELFLQVKEAYEVLSDSSRRFEYDASLGPDAFIKPAVSVNILSSRARIPLIDEPQLFYALVELICTAEVEKSAIAPVHVCMVIDRSNSMNGPRMDMVKSNISQAIKLLKPKDTVSVVTFNDRAEVVIPPTHVSAFSKVENRIYMIQPGGGTEIYQGMLAGVALLRSVYDVNVQRQLILLTDGHTYGDEAACYGLAEQANLEGIAVSTLGIGSEWNDKFLERISSFSGGSTIFISGQQDLIKYFEQKLSVLGSAYARNIVLEVNPDSDVELSYAFRLYPEIAPIQVNSPLQVGNLQYGKNITLLLEFKVNPLQRGTEEISIMDGKIKMQIFLGKSRKARLFVNIKRPVSTDLITDNPPPAVVEAISRLVMYRIQERARQEVENGDMAQATIHLQYLATNLLSRGNQELAHTALMEAEHIRQSQSFSKDGEKRIKYGTRSLMLPSGME
jgi:Ca-activated chloride channel homolog